MINESEYREHLIMSYVNVISLKSTFYKLTDSIRSVIIIRNIYVFSSLLLNIPNVNELPSFYYLYIYVSTHGTSSIISYYNILYCPLRQPFQKRFFHCQLTFGITTVPYSLHFKTSLSLYGSSC